MTNTGTVRAEIEALQAQLKARKAALVDAVLPAASSLSGMALDMAEISSEVSAGARQHMHELERLVHELKSTIESAASDTEASIAAHPLATVLSALLVGYAIGRMSRGST